MLALTTLVAFYFLPTAMARKDVFQVFLVNSVPVVGVMMAMAIVANARDNTRALKGGVL